MQPTPKRRRWPYVLGGIVALLVLAVALFRWDWLIPLAERRASAALGRPVHIAHLHVSLGRVTHVDIDGLTLDNPAGWPGGGQFATIDRLGLGLDAATFIRSRQVVIPAITVIKPVVDARRNADGKDNWSFPTGDPNDTSPGPKLGTLGIEDGKVHVVDEKLAADLNITLATRDDPGSQDASKARSSPKPRAPTRASPSPPSSSVARCCRCAMPRAPIP